MNEQDVERLTAEDDGPECETCGKTDCPDAALPGFSEPHACVYKPIYDALRDARNCDYGCARDYTNQSVRFEVVGAVEDILAARVAAARADGRESLAGEIRALADDLEPVLLGYYGGFVPYSAHAQIADVQVRLRALVAPTGHDGETGEAG